MGEVVNVVVALAVIVFLFRWATSSKETPAERSVNAALGFRPKNVTPDMIETVAGMFPDLPRDNIRYDLLRTGSVELTSNRMLERGYLDAPPPAYYRVYPPTDQQPAAAGSAAARRPAAPSTSSKQPSLISRFNLEPRLSDETSYVEPEEAGGKAVWETTAEKREASLQQRKTEMILAARKRMLAQQHQGAASASGSS